MGGLGLVGAVLATLIIKNPERGRFDRPKTENEILLAEAKKPAKGKKPKGFKEFIKQMADINKNPVCKNIFMAGFLRTLSSMIVTTFVPVFFQRVFPAFKSEYAVINAAALTIFGFSSALIGGILSDRFGKKSYMTNSAIIMTGHFIAVPLTAIACFTNNFWLAISCFAAKIFFSGSYFAPAITMMQNSSDPSDSGFVVSAYTFYAHIAQTIAPLIFGFFANYFGAVGNPRVYGYLVTAAVTMGYLGSNVFYYKAGKEYKNMMEARNK